MGTAQVIFEEDPEDLTIAHAQPEMTSPEAALTGSHGSDRVRMHNRYILYYYYSTKCVIAHDR